MVMIVEAVVDAGRRASVQMFVMLPGTREMAKSSVAVSSK